MIYNPVIGEIYDTLFYGVTYFNQAEVDRTITSHFSDSDFMTSCYEYVKEKVEDLPAILAPFFRYKANVPTPITRFFFEVIDFRTDTCDSFLNKIIENSDILYAKVLESYFGTENSSVSPQLSTGKYIEQLNALEISDTDKLQFSLLMGNWSYMLNALSQTLRALYPHIQHLHKRRDKELEHEYAQMQSEQNAQFYEHLYSVEPASEQFVVTISLLNQYIANFHEKDIISCLLVGLKHEKALEPLVNSDLIDIEPVLVAVGNDIRLSIINELLREKELTPSLLSRNLHEPPTTILRHVDTLYKAKVIMISRRTGLQIFYQLNIPLLKKVAGITLAKLNEQGE